MMTFEKYISELDVALSDLFPQMGFDRRIWLDTGAPLAKDYMLTCSNSGFQGSSYYFEEKYLVHFTSFGAIKSIVESGEFWLSQLRNLMDPREFDFSASLFRLGSNEIEDAKDNQYSASFCSADILEDSNVVDQFNLWRLYGDNATGAAIIFRISNSPSDWQDFHVSASRYGELNNTIFKTLIELIERGDVEDFNCRVDLGKLFPFHKSELYCPEKEVRILCDYREQSSKLMLTPEVIDPTGKKIWPRFHVQAGKKYVCLPLFNKEHLGFVPHLTIEKVILGCALRPEEFLVQQKDLENHFKQFRREPVPVEKSKLSTIYFGQESKT